MRITTRVNMMQTPAMVILDASREPNHYFGDKFERFARKGHIKYECNDHIRKYAASRLKNNTLYLIC